MSLSKNSLRQHALSHIRRELAKAEKLPNKDVLARWESEIGAESLAVLLEERGFAAAGSVSQTTAKE